MNLNINPPLSNLHFELLKLYTHNISEETLLDVKKVLAKFFLDKTRQQADEVWEQKNYSDAFFEQLEQ
jgi:cytochrome c peroxidase